MGIAATPKTENFTNRTKSLFIALQYLGEAGQIPYTQTQQNLLKNLEAAVIQSIQSHWNIDEELEKITEKKRRYQYLETVFKQYRAYIQNVVLPQLLALIPASTYAEALAKLIAAENFCSDFRKVRDEEDVLQDADWPILNREFKIGESETIYFSAQESAGRITDSQLNKINLDPQQQRLLRYTADGKLNRYNNRNCYSRSGEGVAALRKNSCGYINNDSKRVVSLELYRHASPVPYHEKDALKRMAITRRNVEEIVEVLADMYVAKELHEKGGDSTNSAQHTALAEQYNSEANALSIPLTEIRLLSPIRKAFAFLDQEQRQYQQVLESFLAFSSCEGKPFKALVRFPDGNERAIYVKPEINFFDFGVNRFRHAIFSDPLQDWINTRGFNDLSDQVYEKLKSTDYLTAESQTMFAKLYTSHFYEIKKTVHQGREQLKNLYTELTKILALYEESPANKKNSLKNDYDKKLAAIVTMLKKQHKVESNLIRLRESWWRENSAQINAVTSKNTDFLEIWQDFAEAQALYYGKQYNAKENNYCLQKTLVRLNDKIGRTPLTGCNDDKDRGSNLVNRVEADEIFRQQKGHYPRFDDTPEDKGILKKIQATVHSSSSSLDGTEVYSRPGARGYQLYAQDGNEHLDLENKISAKLGKGIYRLSWKLWIKDICFHKNELSPIEQKPLPLKEIPLKEIPALVDTTPSFNLKKRNNLLISFCLAVLSTVSFAGDGSSLNKDDHKIGSNSSSKIIRKLDVADFSNSSKPNKRKQGESNADSSSAILTERQKIKKKDTDKGASLDQNNSFEKTSFSRLFAEGKDYFPERFQDEQLRGSSSPRLRVVS